MTKSVMFLIHNSIKRKALGSVSKIKNLRVLLWGTVSEFLYNPAPVTLLKQFSVFFFF